MINAGRISPETVKANAALILAAPELLAACEAMLEANYMPGSTMTLALNAMAAIAKAKGETDRPSIADDPGNAAASDAMLAERKRGEA